MQICAYSAPCKAVFMPPVSACTKSGTKKCTKDQSIRNRRSTLQHFDFYEEKEWCSNPKHEEPLQHEVWHRKINKKENSKRETFYNFLYYDYFATSRHGKRGASGALVFLHLLNFFSTICTREKCQRCGSRFYIQTIIQTTCLELAVAEAQDELDWPAIRQRWWWWLVNRCWVDWTRSAPWVDAYAYMVWWRRQTTLVVLTTRTWSPLIVL